MSKIFGDLHEGVSKYCTFDLRAVHEISAGHHFMCDRGDSFSADHNDRQVFKMQ